MSERKIKLILKDFEMNNYAETNTQIYQLNTKQNTYLLVSIQVLKAKYLIFQYYSLTNQILITSLSYLALQELLFTL